ncbi:unnamed protein product [Ambrosiozyma monospora]|uniref:Unnamed protein product n=1 Tax=Ambrosiozyma monospora TaxID=43982 RepID=A0ACB5U434_AMBMO|nr:unnamed protein product [Ambrosiozyma monospora]
MLSQHAVMTPSQAQPHQFQQSASAQQGFYSSAATSASNVTNPVSQSFPSAYYSTAFPTPGTYYQGLPDNQSTTSSSSQQQQQPSRQQQPQQQQTSASATPAPSNPTNTNSSPVPVNANASTTTTTTSSTQANGSTTPSSTPAPSSNPTSNVSSTSKPLSAPASATTTNSSSHFYSSQGIKVETPPLNNSVNTVKSSYSSDYYNPLNNYDPTMSYQSGLHMGASTSYSPSQYTTSAYTTTPASTPFQMPSASSVPQQSQSCNTTPMQQQRQVPLKTSIISILFSYLYSTTTNATILSNARYANYINWCSIHNQVTIS